MLPRATHRGVRKTRDGDTGHGDARTGAGAGTHRDAMGDTDADVRGAAVMAQGTKNATHSCSW